MATDAREGGGASRRGELGSLVFGLTLGGMTTIWIALLVSGASATASTIAMIVVVAGVGLGVLILPYVPRSPRTIPQGSARFDASAEHEDWSATSDSAGRPQRPA
jgi:hypothetical protein